MLIPTVKTLLIFTTTDDYEEKVIVDFIDMKNLSYCDVEDAVCDAIPKYLGDNVDWQKHYATYYSDRGYVTVGNAKTILFRAKITSVLEFDGNVFELNPIKI